MTMNGQRDHKLDNSEPPPLAFLPQTPTLPRRVGRNGSELSGGDRHHPTTRLVQTTAHVRETARSLSRINLTWDHPPQHVLIVKKYKDDEIAYLMIKLVVWMLEQKRLTVFVEPSVLEETALKRCHDYERSVSLVQLLRPWNAQEDTIDFIVTLGGDGTVLYVTSLFQESVPPIVSFHLGSLGFLTCFDFSNFQVRISTVIEGRARLNLRMRLNCQIEHLEFQESSQTPVHVNASEHVFQALNEMVVDRGTSSYIAQLELYVEDELITTVNADGLIIATPTGSTAYSLSAGGAIVHPSVPCILVTPICPHTLSFRPLLLPDSVELRVVNPLGSRSSAWASFDGRNRTEIKQGDAIRIRASMWPVPTVCLADTTTDWFESLSRCLNWNVREPQRSFNQSGLNANDMSNLNHRRSLSRVGVNSRPPSAFPSRPSSTNS